MLLINQLLNYQFKQNSNNNKIIIYQLLEVQVKKFYLKWLQKKRLNQIYQIKAKKKYNLLKQLQKKPLMMLQMLIKTLILLLMLLIQMRKLHKEELKLLLRKLHLINMLLKYKLLLVTQAKILEEDYIDQPKCKKV